MNPLCQLHQWSAEDIARLLKIEGTIQYVDGECFFKASRQTRKGCNVATHCHIPLNALNKRFGLYKRIVAHLDASSHHNAAHISPVLDYYLWLYHTSIGFHAEYCEALEGTLGVTFEGLQNFMPLISEDRKQKSYDVRRISDKDREGESQSASLMKSEGMLEYSCISDETDMEELMFKKIEFTDDDSVLNSDSSNIGQIIMKLQRGMFTRVQMVRSIQMAESVEEHR
ncbi:hypothetical protein EDB19DRAFT_1832424 [Suillus lakei]|nr:hypothetical protein EDB19DRAFT_1832424 [Suillus lakei]